MVQGKLPKRDTRCIKINQETECNSIQDWFFQDAHFSILRLKDTKGDIFKRNAKPNYTCKIFYYPVLSMSIPNIEGVLLTMFQLILKNFKYKSRYKMNHFKMKSFWLLLYKKIALYLKVKKCVSFKNLVYFPNYCLHPIFSIDLLNLDQGYPT